MKNNDDRQIRDLLRTALPPLGGMEPSQDLWPRMLRRLDERSISVCWYDWALLALGVLWSVAFPQTIPALLYHF